MFTFFGAGNNNEQERVLEQIMVLTRDADHPELQNLRVLLHANPTMFRAHIRSKKNLPIFLMGVLMGSSACQYNAGESLADLTKYLCFSSFLLSAGLVARNKWRDGPASASASIITLMMGFTLGFVSFGFHFLLSNHSKHEISMKP